MIQYGSISAGSPVALLARVEDERGNLLTTSTTASVTATVTDLATLDAGDPISLDVTNSVMPTLTINDQWSADSIGFNVAARLDGSNFPSPGTTYQVRVVIVPTVNTGGSAFPLFWELQTDDTY
jgi:hypothetical protein